jgi:hypothetical protein
LGEEQLGLVVAEVPLETEVDAVPPWPGGGDWEELEEVED